MWCINMLVEMLSYHYIEKRPWGMSILFGLVATIFSFMAAIIWFLNFPHIILGFSDMVILSFLPAIVTYLVAKYLFKAKESFKIAAIVFIFEVLAFLFLDQFTVISETQTIMGMV